MQEKTLNFNLLVDEDLIQRFEKIAMENGTTAKEVLGDFMKDYIVSSGHPEQVANRWPWNKQK